MTTQPRSELLQHIQRACLTGTLCALTVASTVSLPTLLGEQSAWAANDGTQTTRRSRGKEFIGKLSNRLSSLVARPRGPLLMKGLTLATVALIGMSNPHVGKAASREATLVFSAPKSGLAIEKKAQVPNGPRTLWAYLAAKTGKSVPFSERTPLKGNDLFRFVDVSKTNVGTAADAASALGELKHINVRGVSRNEWKRVAADIVRTCELHGWSTLESKGRQGQPTLNAFAPGIEPGSAADPTVRLDFSGVSKGDVRASRVDQGSNSSLVGDMMMAYIAHTLKGGHERSIVAVQDVPGS